MAEWFAPKRYGYGSGLPISWQGWLVMIAYLILVIGAAIFVSEKPIIFFGILVPATLGLIIVTARTTRGGWRWRWGDKS